MNTLVGDLNRVLRQSGFNVDHSGQYVNGSFHGDLCNYSGVIIFAGRWEDVPHFLSAFNSCSDDRSLHVIADDSISRYLENPLLRRTAPATLPVTYVSKAIPITCEYLQNVHDNASAKFLRLIQEAGFLRSAQENGSLRPRYCGQGNHDSGAIGERVPESYDAANLVLDAVTDLGAEPRPDSSPQEWNPRSIVPAAVYLTILQRLRGGPSLGVTGAIKFTDGGDDVGEPVGRDVSLLRVDDVPQSNTQSVEVFRCNWNRDNVSDSVCKNPLDPLTP